MYWPGGVRHIGGVNPVCGSRGERGKAGEDMVPGDRSDRECSKRRIREGSSTVAEPAGGPSRSSAETPVIGVELVNMNAGSEAVMVGGGLVDCGAVREMEVGWPSRVVLRKKALNRREGPWLKTVVLNVVGKGAAKDRVRYGPGR